MEKVTLMTGMDQWQGHAPQWTSRSNLLNRAVVVVAEVDDEVVEEEGVEIDREGATDHSSHLNMEDRVEGALEEEDGMVVEVVILLQMQEGNVKEALENPIIKVGEEPWEMEHRQWRPFQHYQTHNGDALKGRSFVTSAVLSFMLKISPT